MKAVLKIELYKSWEEKWQNYNKTNVRPFKPTIQHNFESTLFRDCEVIIRRLRFCNINADPVKSMGIPNNPTWRSQQKL